MARKKKDKDGKPGRLKQIGQAYTLTRKSDPMIGLWLAGAFLVPFLVLLGIGFAIDNPVLLGFLGVMIGMTLATVIFGRRAERAAYAQIEGETGAAAASLKLLRRGWTVTPMVAVTKNQDLVHRVVGRPGVVLVGEGAPTRVGNLLAQEKRKIARVAPDVAIHELVAGNGQGQVPLRKLSRRIMKLPKSLTPAQVTELNFRLKALGAQQGTLPIPKGPMPKSARQAKSMRG
ncbi:MAG TPA: DUF4191 domain-containing protein [Actinomycetes bacterium]|nr:DUF4191 domain-containing protein [Actinomycetes bacterium]